MNLVWNDPYTSIIHKMSIVLTSSTMILFDSSARVSSLDATRDPPARIRSKIRRSAATTRIIQHEMGHISTREYDHRTPDPSGAMNAVRGSKRFPRYNISNHLSLQQFSGYSPSGSTFPRVYPISLDIKTLFHQNIKFVHFQE